MFSRLRLIVHCRQFLVVYSTNTLIYSLFSKRHNTHRMSESYDTTEDNSGCYDLRRKLHSSNPDSNHHPRFSYVMQSIKDRDPLSEIRRCLYGVYTLEPDKKSGCSVIMFILKYNLYEDFDDIKPKKISNEDLCVLLNFLVKEKAKMSIKKIILVLLLLIMLLNIIMIYV
jgi:hypothetical protein